MEFSLTPEKTQAFHVGMFKVPVALLVPFLTTALKLAYRTLLINPGRANRGVVLGNQCDIHRKLSF